MLIVNADDWGRCPAETDAALKCFREGRVTSVSAMVFMQDSERAAALAQSNQVDVGLHLNFAEQFTGGSPPAELVKTQERLIRYLMGSKYAQLLYNPFLGRHFSESLRAQLEEFHRLYRQAPSHIDGHHHLHLCGNMLLGTLLPAGSKIRRNFSFWPGEKNLLNRAYRAFIDHWLKRRHRMADYFFDLEPSIGNGKIVEIAELAKTLNVELMTHPVSVEESKYLLGTEFQMLLQRVPKGGYSRL